MLKISVVIPTRDRATHLAELLSTLLDQSYPPYEVVIVDDSVSGSAKEIGSLFAQRFKSIGCKLQYTRGYGYGLTAARNLGVENSRGDAILFLDDDVLLSRNLLRVLTVFLMDHPEALGVQPTLIQERAGGDSLAKKLGNASCKALMLSYNAKNKLAVRRSGASVFPHPITKEISAQRLSGAGCYRREVFNGLSFDTKLKRWGYMEDLDFSYRVYKKKPKSLYAIPRALIMHARADSARLPAKLQIYMKTTYLFYIFFKNIFNASLLNLIAFLWALIGDLAVTAADLAFTGGYLAVRELKPRQRWYQLIYLLLSYISAFKHLKQIMEGDLGFFNRNFEL